eukprot:8487406-Prorocentrum_lima.AAC.1
MSVASESDESDYYCNRHSFGERAMVKAVRRRGMPPAWKGLRPRQEKKPNLGELLLVQGRPTLF